MKSRLLILSLVLLTSCQTYRSQFDCPPSEGIPCTSVSEIQKMIVETPDGGPDIFLGKVPTATCSDCSKKRCRTHAGRTSPNSDRKRIWVEECGSGCSYVQGHYIYFDETCEPGACQ